MPKKPTKMKTDPWTIVFAVLILILVLKALGILKAYLNIDPNGITFTFDIGHLTSVRFSSSLAVKPKTITFVSRDFESFMV